MVSRCINVFISYKHTMFYYTLLHCTLSYCISYKLKVYGNLVSNESIDAIFPTAFAYFVSLCHIW